MRTRLVTVTLVAAGACALGGLAAQSLNPMNVSAASKKSAHATTRTGTVKSHAGSRQTSTTATPHADGTVTAVNGNTITNFPGGVLMALQSGSSNASGPTGTSVTISGLNFGATQGTSAITFNGVAAAPTSWSDQSIVAAVLFMVAQELLHGVRAEDAAAFNGRGRKELPYYRLEFAIDPLRQWRIEAHLLFGQNFLRQNAAHGLAQQELVPSPRDRRHRQQEFENAEIEIGMAPGDRRWRLAVVKSPEECRPDGVVE